MIRIALTVVVGLAAAGCAVSPSAEDPLVAGIGTRTAALLQ